MLSTRCWLEELDLDLLFNIVFAKVGGPDLNLVPLVYAVWRLFDLRLEYRSVLVWSNVSIENEEAQRRAVKTSYLRVENHQLPISSNRDLFCLHDNIPRLFWNFLILKRPLECLITCCDHLMHRKLKLPDEVVCCKIIGMLLIVVRVVYLNLEPLVFLEMEIQDHFSHPFRVQSVMNNLCLAQLLPTFSLEFVENHERVWFWKQIHIG